MSCDFCDDWEPGQIRWYIPADAFTKLVRDRATKCCSCGARIAPGADVVKFPRFKVPEGAAEVRIYGDDGEVPRAPWHMCAPCGNIYLLLNSMKYAVSIEDDMRELSKEHADMVAAGRAGCL